MIRSLEQNCNDKHFMKSPFIYFELTGLPYDTFISWLKSKHIYPSKNDLFNVYNYLTPLNMNVDLIWSHLNHRLKFIKAYCLKYESHPAKSIISTFRNPLSSLTHTNYCISLAFTYWLFVVILVSIGVNFF